ncbi:HAD family hydrolase [Poritiphilus flavus]|uniref:HAD-IA family hydrolase n=1 Tax=Poritiphilus flavus TaxID=2697053 RepID=A0A6L9EF54_9FLAO|nr:HAD family phosphatase [Poritiphilus flavus]NAS13367.1 HAD-IA family hydrolase [Poritiphilus flavus]
MIRNIIFDFGDVFINLDKVVVFREMQKLNVLHLLPQLDELNKAFEVGAISPESFLDQLQDYLPQLTKDQIAAVWNGMLLDLPEYRLEFLEDLAREAKYRLFLLSNTNALHIPHFRKQMGELRFNRFRNSFEQFYLSHEIKLRKPSAEIYEFVLNENGLPASETLFIDDTEENTNAARKLGIHTWNLKVGQEDIIQLKTKI